MPSLTKAKIVENLFETVGLSKNESADVLNETLKIILKTLSEDNQMKIANFGTFKVRKKKERLGRNPKTMEEFKITARKVVTFRPSNLLIKKINRK